MPVLINFKICDNAKECNAIAICKTGCVTWDEKNKNINIDNSKCINCGLCKDCCKVHAYFYVKDQEEYDKVKKQIDEDPRKPSDLFVDRYGATPIDLAHDFSTGPYKNDLEKAFQVEVLESSKPVIMELYNSDSIKCLLFSIPVKYLFGDINIKYRKTNNDNLVKKYNVQQLPALLFFNNGELLGKIEGYYNENQKSELKKKIDEILKE